MDKRVYELINDQINKELYSAYFYMQIADFYEDEGLDGYANYFMVQAAEERDHALIFRKYLLENDEVPELKAIDVPHGKFESGDFMTPLEETLKHEKYVTELINNIYAAADEVKDYRACQFLKWFIDEQMEEEDNASTMITKMKLFGSEQMSLHTLDQEYGSRTYTVPSPLATTEN
jgi:ferritin